MTTLMRFINFIVAIALAAIPALQTFKPECYAQISARYLPQIEQFIMPAGLALIALNVIVLFVRIVRSCSRRPDLEFSTNDEPCVISIAAVEKRLLELAAKFAGVRQARVDLKIRGKNQPVHCTLTFGLACENNITGRIDEIKRCLRDAYDRLLPGTPGVEINTLVSELRAEEKPVNEKKEYDDVNFSGPVYPTAGHSDADV